MSVNTYWQSNTLLIAKRSKKIFAVIEPILAKHGVPDDFKYLAVAESGLLNVTSSAGAKGVWQFMKSSGKAYGLQIDDQVDKDGAESIVAHNVEAFELEYRSNKENDDWVKQWRSDNKGRADHRNKFPHFVKIRFAIKDEKNKNTKGIEHTIVVQVAFPNNEPHMQNNRGGNNQQPKVGN